MSMRPQSNAAQPQLGAFPPTRYMGSKQHILPWLQGVITSLPGRTVLDAFSGSACVAYMLKGCGYAVITNDYLAYPFTIAHALVENDHVTLAPTDLDHLLAPNPHADTFVQEHFHGLYYSDEENAWIDNTLANAWALHGYKRSLALCALSRACIKKRPRGVFTYVGDRYNDGRRDLRLSFTEQFRSAAQALNAAVRSNGQANKTLCGDVFNLDAKADLVYLDPPYFTPHSDNDYLRRYHFVEGLCRRWEGVELLLHTKTHKLRKIATPFDSRTQVYEAFHRLFAKFQQSTIVLSYSSNGLPTQDEIISMLHECGKQVDIVEVPHRYSFGTHSHKVANQNNMVREYLFVAR